MLKAQIESHAHGLKRIPELLSISSPTGHQDRVRSSIHWAGRAVGQRPETAFLYRAIALESLILGSGSEEKSEITTRLAYAVTHLLGEWRIRTRKDTVKDIKSLYSVRSKIVHSGDYEVEIKHQWLLREYIIRCILRILSQRQFDQMRASDDLDEWFRAALRGEPPVADDTTSS